MSDVAGNEILHTTDDDAGNDDAGNRVAGGVASAALEYIAKSIVDDPEAVVVEVDQAADKITLHLHVAPDDKGKVIGKRGRVAIAVRTVIRAVGDREGHNILVDIAD